VQLSGQGGATVAPLFLRPKFGGAAMAFSIQHSPSHSVGQSKPNHLTLIQESLKLDAENAAQSLERAKQYTTVVITLGYAGMFGIWSFCSGVVPKNVHAATGILGGISLLLFIIFEIVKMYAMQAIAVKLLNAIGDFSQPVDPATAAAMLMTRVEQQRLAQRDNQKLMRRLLLVWPYFFWPTIATGFGAMFLLLYNLAASLSGMMPYFPA
jgi:hypothetical protein